MTAAAVWRAPVPSDILPLLAAVVVGGCVAGFLATAPVLFVTSPLVAAGLAAAAVFGRRTPEWNPVAVEALAPGPLVAAACDAARQLAALEVHVDAFEAHPSPRSHDALERCRRGRDLLTQRLQDASAALSRWQAAQGIGVGESLGTLARELNDESRFQQEAAYEVEALLA